MKYMKHLTMILAISCISAACAADPVPEAVNLHPEKYTLRLVRATGEGPMFESFGRMSETNMFEDTFSQKTIYTEVWSTSRFGDEPLPKKNILLSKIEQANPTYTELVSMPIEMGKEFSSDNGLLTGKIWREIDFTDSDPEPSAVASFELKYVPRPIKFDEPPLLLKVGEWVCLGLGGSNKTEWVLIKLYEPQK
jgi:hypothetical protein